MVGWACMVWVVVWAAVGMSGAAHSARDKEVMAPGVLVETLRQVLRVPSSEGGPGGYGRPPRPPRYMLRLYRKLSKGQSALPRRANTVTSITPHTDEGGEREDGLYVYNVSGAPDEYVLGAWLHVRGGGAKFSPRPSRVLVYLLQGHDATPTTPVMTVSIKPGRQEVEVTRAVREAIEAGDGGGDGRVTEDRRPVGGQVGVRVEELRRGRYVVREWVKGSQVTKTPPLLLVYSSDPAILDLAALGVSALNLSSHARPPHPHPRNTHRNPAHGKGAHHYKRFTREVDQGSHTRARRSLEDPWEDVEMVEAGAGGVGGNAHSHAILTNELPLHIHHHALTSAQMPLLPQEARREELRAERRQRRLQRKQRRRGRKENLIPLPKNYSKTKWGEDTRLKNDRRRRRRRRRRRNRRLPEEWMAVAQNTLSNEANVLGSSGLAVGARACERHKLEVNFKDLGWDRFIVAPASFNAFYCAGVCPNPLIKPHWRSSRVCSLSGSNHAIIQSLIYSMGGRPEVPAPCCVPDKLDSLSILFMNGENDFVLKNYPKMSVTSCSCQ